MWKMGPYPLASHSPSPFFIAGPYGMTKIFGVCVCAGSDAGRGDPGDATGLHLTVSRSEQK